MEIKEIKNDILVRNLKKGDMSPFDLLKLSLNEKGVFVSVKGDSQQKETKMIGKLLAYDEHLNIMLSDCKETVFIQNKPIQTNYHSLIFIRGDLVIAVSPSYQNTAGNRH